VSTVGDTSIYILQEWYLQYWRDRLCGEFQWIGCRGRCESPPGQRCRCWPYLLNAWIFYIMEVHWGCTRSIGNCLSGDNKCLWLVHKCSARSLNKGPDSKAQETYFSNLASDSVCSCVGKYFSALLWILSTLVRTSCTGKLVLWNWYNFWKWVCTEVIYSV
jgi:hypothetical protein